MTADGWRYAVVEAVRRAMSGDEEPLQLLVQLLVEQDQAKQALRQVGFGCTGMPWADVVRDIITLTTTPRPES